MTDSVLPPGRHHDFPAHKMTTYRSILSREAGRMHTAPAPRRRKPLIAGMVAAGVVLGTGGAVAYGQLFKVTDTSSVECYAVAEYPADAESFTTMAASSEDGSSTITAAVDACSALWRGGFFKTGEPRMLHPAPDERHDVPPLNACLLSDGRAAVFPASDRQCADLGLDQVETSTAPS